MYYLLMVAFLGSAPEDIVFVRPKTNFPDLQSCATQHIDVAWLVVNGRLFPNPQVLRLCSLRSSAVDGMVLGEMP